MDRRRFLTSSGVATAALLLRPGLAAAVASTGPAGVAPRDEWGGGLPPTGPMEVEAPGDVRFLLVHHSASPNSYGPGDVAGILGSFYRHHTGARGWPDIAYNFLVDRYGRVWEGRAGSLAGPVKGDATGGSQGFAMLACFIGDHSTEPPTPDAAEAMAGLLAALAHAYGIPTAPGSRTSFVSRGSNRHPAGSVVETPTIAAHRDMSLTACPGDAGYALVTGELPARVAVLQAALAGGAEPAPAPEEPIDDRVDQWSVPEAPAPTATTNLPAPVASTPNPRTAPPEPPGGASTAVLTAAGLLGLTTAGAVAAAIAARRRDPGPERPSDSVPPG